ncbi:hypothetical protein SAMN02927924_00866 [Sphingobium faniae]|nr:hypothetical protein SAMN02927924_00866 [Sphingobium faniae]
MKRASLLLFLLLTACQRDASSAPAESSLAPSSSGLERAAIETGVIADVHKLSPVGLYQRRHEAGRDILCVAPDRSGHLRFGLEAVFGEKEGCRGQGMARNAGDKLILSFQGNGKCIIVAQYDGDQIMLPGVVDVNCAALCEGKGSVEGVSFPRIASMARAALDARDRAGAALCSGN